jgi:hypothetical protein
MRDTEEIVAEVATALHGRPVVLSSTQEIDVTPPWPRITLREAFEWFASTKLEDAAQDEDRFFRLLVECVEPALESVGAVFLCEYPSSMASLARKKPGDPSGSCTIRRRDGCVAYPSIPSTSASWPRSRRACLPRGAMRSASIVW